MPNIARNTLVSTTNDIKELTTGVVNAFGGTGLGLSTCKSIVEAHGGKIWAQNSEDGRGSIFYFELPIVVDIPRLLGQLGLEFNKQLIYNKYKRTIKNMLFVHEDADIIFTSKIILEENGFKVDSFGDPLEVLRAFRPGIYDLLLTGVRMPGIDGFGLYRELEKIDKNIKVCYFTSFEIDPRIVRMSELRNYIQFPIGISDIITRIKELEWS
jgi:CheY-like chemotaxis protein